MIPVQNTGIKLYIVVTPSERVRRFFVRVSFGKGDCAGL